MEGMLSLEFNNQKVEIVSLNFDNALFIKSLQNIGIFSGAIVFVKAYPFNKKNIHLVINNIEYAIRTIDAKNIWVRSICDNEEYHK